ncbi:MAG: hypothetical protein QXI19_13475 [Candidatus Caldarchaeum sp.]
MILRIDLSPPLTRKNTINTILSLLLGEGGDKSPLYTPRKEIKKADIEILLWETPTGKARSAGLLIQSQQE